MLVSRFHLGAHAATSTDATRPLLANVMIEGDTAIATDGHILVKVAGGSPDPADFPAPADGATPLASPILLPARDAKDAAARLKKHGDRMPLLQWANVERNGTPRLRLTDLEATAVYAAGEPGDDRHNYYPDTEHVWPKGEPTMVVGVMLETLERFVKTLKATTDNRFAVIRLELHAPNKAIAAYVTDSGHPAQVSGLLMPATLPDAE